LVGLLKIAINENILNMAVNQTPYTLTDEHVPSSLPRQKTFPIAPNTVNDEKINAPQFNVSSLYSDIYNFSKYIICEGALLRMDRIAMSFYYIII
jgi:hypothetical protein